MGKCDIKESGKAWNDGVQAFKKAFKFSGGKTTESLNFAINEVRSKHPDLDFEPNTFIDPIVKSCKDAGLIPKNYSFEKSGNSTTSPEKKIEAIAKKMDGLNDNEKKAFARKSFEAINKTGLLSSQKVKDIYAEAAGKPHMTEKISKQIDATAEALQNKKKVDDEIQSKIKEMQADKDANNGDLNEEQDKKYVNEFAELAAKSEAATKQVGEAVSKFSDSLQEKKFWLHQLGDYMPLNLMNPVSLLKNVSGAVADWAYRTMANTILPVGTTMYSKVTGKPNSSPIGARLRGLKRARLRHKAAMAWKGHTDFNNELPHANHMNAVARLRRAMDDVGFDKFKGIISGILKIHPSGVSKALNTPDAMAYEAEYAQELNRIAESKGLKGAEKEAFFLSPDEKSQETAVKHAQTITFKQDLPGWLSGVKKLSAYDAHEAAKKKIQEGMNPTSAKLITGMRALLQKSAVPFIKTPINIVRVATSIVLPEYGVYSALMAAKKETDATEKQRKIAEGVAAAAVGYHVRHVAIQMVAQGLISAGFSDEDKDFKDIVEKEAGGPNRINISALMRGLFFQDIKKQTGDTWVDLTSLGALGVAMAVYSHAFGHYGKKELEERTSYSKSLLNAITVPYDLAWSSISSSLDFTFFTGINQLQGAILNREGYERNQVAVNYFGNLFTGVLPSTYQKLSTQFSPEVKRQYNSDLEVHDNLANMLGYRFFFQSEDLRNKYYNMSEKENGGLKKKNHMFFDNYMGRVLESEFDFAKVTGGTKVDSPIHRLYDAAKEVSKDERGKLFPSAVSDQVSVTKAGKHFKIKLTPDQHDYLQERASVNRMVTATPFIMSDDFKKASFEDRAKVLDGLYQKAVKEAQKALFDKYPDIKKQKIEGSDTKASKTLLQKYK
jgi:hypothetical protein